MAQLTITLLAYSTMVSSGYTMESPRAASPAASVRVPASARAAAASGRPVHPSAGRSTPPLIPPLRSGLIANKLNCWQLKMNLKQIFYLYAKSSTQRCPKEIMKIFLIEDFFPFAKPWAANISANFRKIRNGPNGIIRGFWGNWFMTKTRSKKSRDTVPLSPAMGARNQVGMGLSYRPASLNSLATQLQSRFLGSIPHPRDLSFRLWSRERGGGKQRNKGNIISMGWLFEQKSTSLSALRIAQKHCKNINGSATLSKD